MRIPFGVDNIGNDYLFKLSFYKINKNEEYQRFHNFIVELRKSFPQTVRFSKSQE